MRTAFLVVPLLLLVAPVASADRIVRTLTVDPATTGVDRVEVDFPVGELEVAPSPDDQVHLRVDVRCRGNSERCEDSARDVSIRTRTLGATLKLDLEHDSEWTMHRMRLFGVLRIPPTLAVRLKLGVGQITLRDLKDDVSVHVGVGEARLRLRESDVRAVDLSSGVGEASLVVGRRHLEGSGWLGHHVRWSDGAGRSHVEVELGVGETEVILD
jgi:hypothetical protein